MLWDAMDYEYSSTPGISCLSRSIAVKYSSMKSRVAVSEAALSTVTELNFSHSNSGSEQREISRRSRRPGEKGNSLIEFAFIAPWFFVLFTGVVDTGFATYGLIAVQNAARVAALHGAANVTTASDQAGACAMVIQELRGLPQIGSSFSSTCSSDPLRVTVRYCDGSTPCSGSATSVDNGPATFVSVTYQLPHLFQLPLTGLTSITRTAEMRLRDPLP